MDYGNVEIVSELFQWDPVCETIPLQAIVLNISDMEELQSFMRLTRGSQNGAPMKRIEDFLWDHLYFDFSAEIM